MIKSVMVFNGSGQPRVLVWYQQLDVPTQQRYLREIVAMLLPRHRGSGSAKEVRQAPPPSTRAAPASNGSAASPVASAASPPAAPAAPSPAAAPPRTARGTTTAKTNFLAGSALLGGAASTQIIYRHYATLYFVFVADASESPLAILDLIQVFVEALDRAFTHVCELDLIFKPDEVQAVLAEVVSGGLVAETQLGEIGHALDAVRVLTK